MIYTKEDMEFMMGFYPKHLRHLCFKNNPHLSETTSIQGFNENKEMVNHPNHYGGKDNQYEAIKVIEAWDLGFNLGNTVKYISRAGKKDKDKHIQDLEKALFYLKREIENLKNG